MTCPVSDREPHRTALFKHAARFNISLQRCATTRVSSCTAVELLVLM